MDQDQNKHTEVKDHHEVRSATDETGESKIQELSDEGAEELQKEGVKSKKETDSFEFEIQKNPMLLSPVISCLFKFLNVTDIKNCRLVSRDWSTVGKAALWKKALIHFYKNPQSNSRLPQDFHACFLDTATNFSAFKISGELTVGSTSNTWTIEELTKLFEEKQIYLKELDLQLTGLENTVTTTVNLNSWISKSPLVKVDANYMTKLSIVGCRRLLNIQLTLIAHIRDLTLSRCRINVEAGSKFYSNTLTLDKVAFILNAIELDPVLINNVVDLEEAKQLTLNCGDPSENWTNYSLNLFGNVCLESLVLSWVKLINGKTSQWVVDRLTMVGIPYSLNSQMKIKEIYLSRAGAINFFLFPTSIQKIALHEIGSSSLQSSQPIVFKNLQYLHIGVPLMQVAEYSYIAHFKNCPQLTILQLDGGSVKELKSVWMPKTVRTLILQDALINWLDDNYLHLDKLIHFLDSTLNATKLLNSKIRAQDVIVVFKNLKVNASLVDFLEYQKNMSFGRRFFIGKLRFEQDKIEDSVLNGLVDVKSSFYVFENGEKGRAVSENDFLALIPKHK